MWRALHEIARRHGMEVVAGNAVHLKQRRWLRHREIASIHDVGLENDITVNPKCPRAAELLQDLGAEVFRASGDGPLEMVERAGDASISGSPAGAGSPGRS